jgi:hypothetical protein
MRLPNATPRTPLEFADCIWSDYSGGFLTVCFKHPDPEKSFRHFWNERKFFRDLAGKASTLAKDGDVYFGLASYQNQNRELQSVKHLNWLFADIDGNSLGTDTPKPTIVTETSSGRRQVLWALEGNPSPVEVENRTAAIAAYCGLTNAAIKANQIIRVAGTPNHKPGRNNCVVYIEAYRPHAIYKLEDFAHLASPTVSNTSAPVTLISPSEAYALWFGAYQKLSPRIKRLAYCQDVEKPNGKQYFSASEATLSQDIASVYLYLPWQRTLRQRGLVGVAPHVAACGAHRAAVA